MKKVLLAAGTRPNWIKLRPLHSARPKRRGISVEIADLGQHYSPGLLREMIEPHYRVSMTTANDKIFSFSHGFEKILTASKPDICVVVGDCASSMRAAVTAYSLKIPICHIEAGARSVDSALNFVKGPVENTIRRAIDLLATLNMAATRQSLMNLREEKLPAELTGDLLYDNWLRATPEAGFLKRVIPQANPFILLTLHRRELMQQPALTARLINAVGLAARDLDLYVYLPAHPHLKKVMNKRQVFETVLIDQPASYLEMMGAIALSSLVITDSGGLQKEAFWAGKKLITVRDSTEWPETLKNGWNVLVNPFEENSEQSLYNAIHSVYERTAKETPCQDDKENWGDGHAATTIWYHILKYLGISDV